MTTYERKRTQAEGRTSYHVVWVLTGQHTTNTDELSVSLVFNHAWLPRMASSPVPNKTEQETGDHTRKGMKAETLTMLKTRKLQKLKRGHSGKQGKKKKG